MTQDRSAGERLYQEAVASYGAALERVARGYERDADRRRDLLQDIHIYRHHVSSGPVGLGRLTGAEHYRSELIRQRDLAADSWGDLLPFVPGVALNIAGGALDGKSRAQIAVVVGLAVILFIGVAAINARTARPHQRELDAIEAL